MNTFAEGLATRVPFENTQRIMRKYVDDFILVDDDDIRACRQLVYSMISSHKNRHGRLCDARPAHIKK